MAKVKSGIQYWLGRVVDHAESQWQTYHTHRTVKVVRPNQVLESLLDQLPYDDRTSDLSHSQHDRRHREDKRPAMLVGVVLPGHDVCRCQLCSCFWACSSIKEL